MAFKPIPVEVVDASTINRIQANVASEFAALEGPNGIGITSIASSKNLKTYAALNSDRYLVINASGGAITITLPVPGNQQVITILQTDQTSNVKIAYPNSSDPKKGNTTFTLAGPTTLLNTGIAWVKL